jgi:hypothetical protein
MSVVTVHVHNSQSTGSIETNDYFFTEVPTGSGMLSPNSALYPIIKVFDGRGYHKYWYTGSMS